MASENENPLESALSPQIQDDTAAISEVQESAPPSPSAPPPAITRAEMDSQIASGADVPADALQAALRALIDGDSDWKAISPELRALYFKRGVEYALDSHDSESSLLIALAMDADPALDDQLWGWLYESMGKQPDSVYAFARARLSSPDADQAVFERWQPRLKAAAQVSLQVAIADGDWATITDWLKLIGREPTAYGLSDVFIRGVRLAQPRAHAEPDLAVALIVLTAKRSQTTLETLLEDAELLSALPDENLRAAFTNYTAEPLALFNLYGADVFLVAIRRATDARARLTISSPSIEQLWALLNGTTTIHVTGDYTPERIVESWIRDGAEWLDDHPLDTLLRLALADRRDEVFHRLIFALKDRPDFIALAARALHNSGRSVSDTLALISQLVANGDLTSQGAVYTYSALLRAWEFDRSTVLMMAQLVRAIQYHPELQVEGDVLWRMLDAALETREDLIARVTAKRLTAELETLDDDVMFADGLVHLYLKTGWNTGARSHVINWWRGFVRAQNGARLARIEKTIDPLKPEKSGGDKALNEKSLQELREIMQTVMAFRRMLGKRTLDQFAEAVGITYDILQAFAESYDPSPKRGASFDETTIRAELEARAEELSPHARKILANNLKDLAELVAEMGDNRSKASLRRRSEDVDRALMTGDQVPHSAVDALKWLSGYLSGAHDTDASAEV